MHLLTYKIELYCNVECMLVCSTNKCFLVINSLCLKLIRNTVRLVGHQYFFCSCPVQCCFWFAPTIKQVNVTVFPSIPLIIFESCASMIFRAENIYKDKSHKAPCVKDERFVSSEFLSLVFGVCSFLFQF